MDIQNAEAVGIFGEPISEVIKGIEKITGLEITMKGAKKVKTSPNAIFGGMRNFYKKAVESLKKVAPAMDKQIAADTAAKDSINTFLSDELTPALDQGTLNKRTGSITSTGMKIERKLIKFKIFGLKTGRVPFVLPAHFSQGFKNAVNWYNEFKKDWKLAAQILSGFEQGVSLNNIINPAPVATPIELEKLGFRDSKGIDPAHDRYVDTMLDKNKEEKKENVAPVAPTIAPPVATPIEPTIVPPVATPIEPEKPGFRDSKGIDSAHDRYVDAMFNKNKGASKVSSETREERVNTVINKIADQVRDSIGELLKEQDANLFERQTKLEETVGALTSQLKEALDGISRLDADNKEKERIISEQSKKLSLSQNVIDALKKYEKEVNNEIDKPQDFGYGDGLTNAETDKMLTKDYDDMKRLYGSDTSGGRSMVK